MPDAYVKQTWVNGVAGATPISAARLSHIEDGIENATVLDGTYADSPTPGVARTAVATTTDQTITGIKDFSDTSGLKYKGQVVARVNEGPLSLLDPRVNGDLAAAVAMVPGGGDIFCPPGEYELPTTAITMPTGLNITGDNSISTLFNGNRADGGPAFTTVAGVRRIKLERFRYVGKPGSGDFFEPVADFGSVTLDDLHVSPVTRGIDLSAGTALNVMMQNVRVLGGTSEQFYLSTAGSPLNTVVCLECYADGQTVSTMGYVTGNGSFIFVGTSSDAHSQNGYQLGGRNTIIGATAEANTLRGFYMAGGGSGRINLINPYTFNQLVPYEIAGGNAVTMERPVSAGTPSGFGLVMGSGAVGDNRIFGSAGLDGGISKHASARLTNFTTGKMALDDVAMTRSAANVLDLEIGTVIGAQVSEAADGETALLVRRNVGGTLSLQRVTMGAVDSGGAGFKVLRVAN